MPSISISAEGQEEKVQLDAAIVTLGRGLESDIRLKDIKSSRRHCQIVKIADGYKLVDLGSGNGTFLNGVAVKEQKLATGDKIQIGQTVITFEGGANGKSAPAKTGAAKAATGGVPKTTGAQKTATGRVTTQAQPQTKPSTARVPTGQHAAAKTQKSGGTSRIQKAAAGSSPTALSRATTGKITASSRKTTSASEKFKIEAGKKKSNPIVVILIGAGVVVVLAVIGILFMGSGNAEGELQLIKEKIEKKLVAARTAEDANDTKLALKHLQEALALAEGKEAFKATVMDIKGRIADVEAQGGDVDRANKRWQEFKDEYEKPPEQAKKVADLLDMARKLKMDYGSSKLPWVAELGQRIEALENLDRTNKQIEAKGDFQNFRNEMNEKHKLTKLETGMFGPAIKEWTETFIPKAKEAGKADVVRQAESEVIKLQGRCKEVVARLKNRIDGLEKAEAAAAAKQALEQVAGSEAEADAKELVSKHQ
jgi:pSer/pThr/pTyr-binding forkhead associated (FHA) protein